MRRRLSAILILAGLGTSSCAGRINNMMRSWEGAHYSDLIMRWGPPQGVYDDGQGGRILVYTTSRSWTTPGQATTIWGQAQSITRFVPPQTQGYTAWRVFRINRSGIIYNWSWRWL